MCISRRVREQQTYYNVRASAPGTINPNPVRESVPDLRSSRLFRPVCRPRASRRPSPGNSGRHSDPVSMLDDGSGAAERRRSTGPRPAARAERRVLGTRMYGRQAARTASDSPGVRLVSGTVVGRPEAVLSIISASYWIVIVYY